MKHNFEQTNRKFKQFLDEWMIQLRHSKRLNHAPTVERANRTIQGLIGRFCTNNNSPRYIDHLAEIISTYINRVHRMIKMTPEQADNDYDGAHEKLRELLL